MIPIKLVSIDCILTPDASTVEVVKSNICDYLIKSTCI